MEKIKFISSLCSTIFSTTWEHSKNGAPMKSWDLKFHLLYSIMKKSMSFQPGQNLNKIRSNMDININPPLKGFHVNCTYISDHYRELSHKLIKEILIEELGFYPLLRKESFWQNSPPLEMEFAMPKGKDFDKDKNTIFYLHGGAYILCSTNTHRPMYCRLAKKADCQVAALNYRLAPEYPFPCALEDTLAAYLYLTENSTTEYAGIGMDPSKIVISGDSAGGGLSSSFLLLLNKLKKYKTVSGALLLSPWTDLTNSQPSYRNNQNDYLPGPSLEDDMEVKGYHSINKLLVSALPHLKKEISEINGHFYAKESILKYPLVSPLFAESFDGLPPIMIIIGDTERLRDEGVLFAHKLKNNNISVLLHIYEEMPHVFQLFNFHASSKKSYELGSLFIKDCLNNVEIKDVHWAYKIDTKLNLNKYHVELNKEGLHSNEFKKEVEQILN